MKVFLQHVGSPGNIDIPFTVTTRVAIDRIVNQLPSDAPERAWFSTELRSAFPEGRFSCWGVPDGAKRNFERLKPGDLVLIFPTAMSNGALEQIGIVRALCPFECWEASQVLWPKTQPVNKSYPFVFFFDTEIGHREWPDFLEDIGYAPNWDPRGHFYSIADDRFLRYGGAEGYLEFLRQRCGFRPLPPEDVTA